MVRAQQAGDDSVAMFIPRDDTNKEWRMYQAWLAAGNKPEPVPEDEPLPLELKPRPNTAEFEAELGGTQLPPDSKKATE